MSNLILRQNSPVSAIAITPSNSEDNIFSMVYVGGTGDVKVQGEDGVDVTFSAVPAGQYVFIRTRKVYATGTTATLLVGIG